MTDAPESPSAEEATANTATNLNNSSSSIATAAAKLAAQTSNYVYIQDDAYAWIPARVEKSDGEGAHLVIPEYKDEKSIQSDGGRRAKRFRKQIVPSDKASSLPLQNVDEHGNLKEVEDMVDLSFLHEVRH